MRRAGFASIVGLLLCGTGAVAASLPFSAAPVFTESAPDIRLGLPIAPFDGALVPARVVEGDRTTQVWHLPETAANVDQIIAPLSAALREQGFQPLLDCQAVTCGGFDFRFGIEVAPAPTMFVDLAAYRFASFEKPDSAEFVTLLVSKAGQRGYVQMVSVTPAGAASTAVIQSTRSETPDGLLASGLSMGEKLVQTGRTVLDDLEFATGAAELTEASFQSLSALADWLRANPNARVALVGHTDAVGALEGNVALSKRRADAVVRRMIDRHAIDPTQMTAEGVGFLAPRASNQTDAGRTSNRRVEVVLTQAPG